MNHNEKTSKKPMLNASHLSGSFFTGEWIKSNTIIKAIEPATGKKIADVGMASVNDIRSACAYAKQTQIKWANLPYDKRATIMRQAALKAEMHSDEIVDWLIRESGSIRAKAEFEVQVTIKALWEAANAVSQAQGQVLPSHTGCLSLARRRPLGVVGIISPFNFPLYLAMRALAPAIAIGNAVVLKPDPRTAICGGTVIARLFEEAGLPKGVLQMLPGDGAAGAALCDDAHIAMIQFTGSTQAGRKVGESASRNLKKLSLELGGKNSIIVLDDADLELAVKNVAWSTYLHQGQICMSAGRIIVLSSIADEFIQRLKAHAEKMSVGNPATDDVAIGPLINQHQLDNAQSILDASVAKGAHHITGGKSNGLFFQPTILTQVTNDMKAYHEEIFAPVAVIIIVDTDEEALAVANDTTYGLSAAIMSKSISRALSLVERIRAGLVHINDSTVNDDVVNPFGGVGDSGNGTSIGGPANWEEFSQWQWVTIKGDAPAYPL